MRTNLQYAALPEPAASALQFARDVLFGLALRQKSVPSAWLHDRRGAQLFEEIAHAPEHYPVRAEILILKRCVKQIADLAGPNATVIELGSGSPRGTPILLGALEAPQLYVPLDASAQALEDTARRVQAQFPALAVRPIVGDLTRLQDLPPPAAEHGGRRLLFVPGATIGNFAPDEATRLLQALARVAGEAALLVVGADGTREPRMLLPAYDDPRGVGEAFARNLLVRINRELEGDFEPEAFRHEARYDPRLQRVEMHLVSLRPQSVTVLGRRFHFAADESIHTASAYKHGLLRFQAMASRAGWSQRQLWADSLSGFAVHVFERTG